MSTRQKERLANEKKKAKEDRRTLVQAALLDVMDKQINSAPWNMFTSNSMRQLFHTAMPELDIIPLARSYIKGHAARTPARAAVASDIEEKATDQILRTRALLAKLLCATDDALDANTLSCQVTLPTSTIKQLEDDVRWMTTEQLMDGDAWAKELLYHPTAFFYPVKPRIDENQVVAKQTARSNGAQSRGLIGSIVSGASASPPTIDAMMDRLHSASSATSFYPAVFNKALRPERTTPVGRELHVDSVLRDTATFLLQSGQEDLEPQWVLELALNNIACFQCGHCPDLAKAKHGQTSGAVNWTQMVSDISPSVLDILHC